MRGKDERLSVDFFYGWHFVFSGTLEEGFHFYASPALFQQPEVP